MRKEKKSDKKRVTVALAGNPNVGKSTVYNSLTGRNVHTGNWAGKTVGCESATLEYDNYSFHIVDIPGAYSLFSHSEEERIARDYICFGAADVTVVVCDACAIEQNLNLLMQIIETGASTVLCLNFIEAARRSGRVIDTDALSEILGIPVVSAVAYKRRSLDSLLSETINSIENKERKSNYILKYPEPIESAAAVICRDLEKEVEGPLLRWLSLRLIDAEGEFLEELINAFPNIRRERLLSLREEAITELIGFGIEREHICDLIAEALVKEASIISAKVTFEEKKSTRPSRLDRILTGRVTAYPIMLFFLFLVLWITLSLANYPSMLLGTLFNFLEARLTDLFEWMNFPTWLSGALIGGAFRTLGQVVSVMLPPMVIFFPLFALLEDWGYLPRIAYNLDRPFACSGACGKQALTMCMGLGCNAVGIVGARIIDSKRERNLAIVTNSFMPCNGRLPMIITLISVIFLFLVGEIPSLAVAGILSLLIVFAVLMTFLFTAILSKTAFKGKRSPFTIELPPFRRPRFLSVIYHSLKDKCLSVLIRAVIVSAPMGLLIWILANLKVGDASLITMISDFLLPFGSIMGLDGVILLAFILGLPANEIVIPIMLMIYSSGGVIGAGANIGEVSSVFAMAGWSAVTAISAAILALFHSPCSTSLITVYKETKSPRLTFLSFLLPSAIGVILCIFINLIARVFA